LDELLLRNGRLIQNGLMSHTIFVRTNYFTSAIDKTIKLPRMSYRTNLAVLFAIIDGFNGNP